MHVEMKVIVLDSPPGRHPGTGLQVYAQKPELKSYILSVNKKKTTNDSQKQLAFLYRVPLGKNSNTGT